VVEVRRLGGRLRGAFGGRSVSVPEGSVRALLEALVARGGDAVAGLLYQDPGAGTGAPHRDLRVLVNGRNVEFLEGLDTAVAARDAVTIFFSGARGYPGG
jgi:molybdopterin converting factor small subunit